MSEQETMSPSRQGKALHESTNDKVFAEKRPIATRAWDLWAGALSSACLLHCLALPLFISLVPVGGQFVDDHVVHLGLVLLAAPITLRVVWREGVSGHGSLFTPVALSGLALMVIAVTVFESYEVPLTVAGSSLLAGAHLWRWFRHTSPQRVSE